MAGKNLPPGEEMSDPFSAPDPLALSPDELAKIKAEAKAQVEKELRQQIVKEAKAAALSEARREAGLEVPDEPQEYVEVRIDLPPFTDRLRIDRKIYMHGTVAKVRPDVAISMIDQMQWSWRHEHEIEGKFFTTHKRWVPPKMINTGERFYP